MSLTFPLFVQEVNKRCSRRGGALCSITKLESVYALLERQIKMEYLGLIFEGMQPHWNTGCALRFLGCEVRRYIYIYLYDYLHHVYMGMYIIDFTLAWLWW